jgi:hypothetical protein
MASVIYGADGLRDQIDRLLSSEERRHVLIAWLLVRAEGKAWKEKFDRCLDAYFLPSSKAVVVGILLSGRTAEEAHLRPVRAAVEARLTSHSVILLGYYLPIPVADWPAALEGTEDRP